MQVLAVTGSGFCREKNLGLLTLPAPCHCKQETVWGGHSAGKEALHLAMGLLASHGQLRGCWPSDSWESNSLGSRGGRLLCPISALSSSMGWQEACSSQGPLEVASGPQQRQPSSACISVTH